MQLINFIDSGHDIYKDDDSEISYKFKIVDLDPRSGAYGDDGREKA